MQRDRADAGGLRGRVVRGRAAGDCAMTKIPRPMAVTVKIPAQLRAATEGEGELEVEGATVGEALDAVFEQHDGAARADHRGRRSAPLRERLRLRRGHPLPGRARHRSSPTATRYHPARRRRRLEAARALGPTP